MEWTVPMRRIAAALALVAGVALAVPPPAVADGSLRGAALTQALSTRRLTKVKFEKSSLDDVVKYVRIATGWNYVVKRVEIRKAGIDIDALSFTIEASDVTVANLLDVLLSPYKLEAKVEGNIVFFTTHADALGKPVVRLHGISHLTWQKTDFHGPDINLYPTGYTPPVEYQPEVPVEDDPFLDPTKIADLVKELVGEDWDANGWTITATKMYMVVKAPIAIQKKVTRILQELAAWK